MKKLLPLLFVLTLVLFSCKKTSSDLNVIEKTSNLTDNISVSKTGFLIFKNTATVLEYSKILKSPQGNNVLNSLIAKGFKNKDSQVQRENTSNLTSEELELYSQYFSANNFLQIANVVMRISDDYKKLLVAKENNVNSTVLSAMEAGIFNAQTMNSINVERLENQNFDLIEFSNANPSGVAEVESSLMNNRPMFGKRTRTFTQTDTGTNAQTGGCQSCTHTYTQTTVYTFWIADVHDPVYQGTTCVNIDGPC